MTQKKSLSPTLFLVLEFFILIPSIIFVFGILQFIFFQHSSILDVVLPKNAVFQNFFITIISPTIGGLFAYQYLEHFKPRGFIALKAKGIIFYSIILVGLVIFYSFFTNIIR